MLHLLPLESFEQRYTKDWSECFPIEFNKAGLDFDVVVGDTITDRIETGRFLDIFGTIYYKETQMAKVAGMFRADKIQDGDVIFDMDLWRPDLAALPYMAQLSNRDVKIVGILHAGSYDPNDFLAQAGLGVWAEHVENGWLSFIDTIFVATNYHKELIIANRVVDKNKIKVTGLPFYGKQLRAKFLTYKEPLIVFPHRLDSEKQPNLFEELRNSVPYRCVRTFDIWEGSKDRYYSVLARAKVAVSFALQETFGYAMLEATALDCIPLVPNRLSYNEIYSDTYRFENMDELRQKIEHAMNDNLKPIPEITYHYDASIQRMVDEI